MHTAFPSTTPTLRLRRPSRRGRRVIPSAHYCARSLLWLEQDDSTGTLGVSSQSKLSLPRDRCTIRDYFYGGSTVSQLSNNRRRWHLSVHIDISCFKPVSKVQDTLFVAGQPVSDSVAIEPASTL